MSCTNYSASEIAKKNRDQTLYYFYIAQQNATAAGRIPRAEQPTFESAVVVAQRTVGGYDVTQSTSANPYGFNPPGGNGPGQKQ